VLLESRFMEGDDGFEFDTERQIEERIDHGVGFGDAYRQVLNIIRDQDDFWGDRELERYMSLNRI